MHSWRILNKNRPVQELGRNVATPLWGQIMVILIFKFTVMLYPPNELTKAVKTTNRNDNLNCPISKLVF